VGTAGAVGAGALELGLHGLQIASGKDHYHNRTPVRKIRSRKKVWSPSACPVSDLRIASGAIARTSRSRATVRARTRRHRTDAVRRVADRAILRVPRGRPGGPCDGGMEPPSGKVRTLSAGPWPAESAGVGRSLVTATSPGTAPVACTRSGGLRRKYPQPISTLVAAQRSWGEGLGVLGGRGLSTSRAARHCDGPVDPTTFVVRWDDC
jgi:hypothetical protein